MRELAVCLIVVAASACKVNEHVAEAPVDGAEAPGIDAAGDGDGNGSDIDAGDTTSDAPDASECGRADRDGDSVPDCVEEADGDPFTDPAKFNGFHVIVGEKPNDGHCNHLDDYNEMQSRFASPKQEIDAYSGWAFDTGKDAYTDPEYGFAPQWPKPAEWFGFSLRYRGQINLKAGPNCFRIDIGATGTDIFSGHDECGQLYLGIGGLPSAAFAQTGYGAPSVEAAKGCVTIPADGAYPFDIVFWYFDVTKQAKLDVRQCAGANCTPSQPITAKQLQVR